MSYNKFFTSLADFKAKQDKQKQRGLNNYNILTSVLKATDEVRLHSRMIKSLLDVNGSHYQEALFLEIFINTLGENDFSINTKNCSIYAEYKNIDLYISDGKKHIILENKINANDQKEQIKRYIETIKDENNEASYEDILVIYLSKEKRDPSDLSLEDLRVNSGYIYNSSDEKVSKYKAISYKLEILEWLNKCKFEVQNITNLNESIGQYIDVVQIINKQYQEKIMSLSNYIKNNKSIYKIALEVHKAIPNVRKEIADEFFNSVINNLMDKLGNEWIVEIEGDLNKKENFPLKIYKKTWGENSLIFGFEFSKNDYYYGYYGVVRRNSSVKIKPDIKVKYRDELSKINYCTSNNAWWLHREYLPAKIEHQDFIEYILSENSENKFIERILTVIDDFEKKSSIITNINIYLENN